MSGCYINQRLSVNHAEPFAFWGSAGEFATVLQKWIGTAEFFFSHCLADSEDNIIKQLEIWGVNQFFNTMVMETHYWCSAYKPAQEPALMPPIEL